MTVPQIGTVLARFVLPVEVSKAREMALALHAADPRWRDAAPERLEGLAVVPTFTAVSAFWHDRQGVITDGVGLDLTRLLHGEQRWTYQRPVLVGDMLSATTTLSGMEERRGRHGTMRIVTLTTDYDDRLGDELVLSEDTVLIELEQMPAHTPAADPARKQPPPVPVTPDALGPAWSYGPLTRTDIVRYAGAGGDFNPVHHDEPHAQSLGLPGIFAMGLLHAGMLGTYLARHVPAAHLRQFSVRFRERVWPGDHLLLSGREEQHGRYALEVLNGAGSPVLTAAAEVSS